MVDPIPRNHNARRDISHAFASFTRAYAGTVYGCVDPATKAWHNESECSALGLPVEKTDSSSPVAQSSPSTGGIGLDFTQGGYIGTPSTGGGDSSSSKKDSSSSSSKKKDSGSSKSSSKKKDDKSKTDTTTPSTTPATTTTTPPTTSQTPVADGLSNAFHRMFTSFCGSGKGLQFLCKDEGTFTMFAFAFIFAILVYLMKKH